MDDMPAYARDFTPEAARLPVATDASTEELAQRILMGMQRDIETQIEWRLAQAHPEAKRGISQAEIPVILGSIGIGVPLTAIAAAGAGFPGILVTWIALVLINVAWAARR